MKRIVVVLGWAAARAAAQSATVIDYSKLPNCATGCSVLKQAENNCVPPAAPVTNQGIYQSCVCQSTLLTSLHSSGSVCQQTGCSPDDANKISAYYEGLCSGPVVTPSAASTLSTHTTSARSSTGTNKATTPAGVGNNALVANSKQQSWWDGHKRWVAMAVVVVVGLSLIAIVSALLRRRHNRKKDAARANLAAHDAPYQPSTPNSKSTYSEGSTLAPMAMSGGLNGGVGGIAGPRGVQRLRSRSGTLQSLGLANGSRTTLQEPVAWGPHQHLANAQASSPSSPSYPSRPTSTIMAPTQVYRNNDALRSEPRISQYRPVSGISGISESSSYQGMRPHTAGEMLYGGSRALNAVRSDPVLSPHAEGEIAEICESSPQRPGPNKLRRNA